MQYPTPNSTDIQLASILINYFGPGWMTGRANQEHRRSIMQTLFENRLPLSKCGVNAMTAAVYDYAKSRGISIPENRCRAEQRSVLMKWIEWVAHESNNPH
jgi:hypothetical protein